MDEKQGTAGDGGSPTPLFHRIIELPSNIFEDLFLGACHVQSTNLPAGTTVTGCILDKASDQVLIMFSHPDFVHDTQIKIVFRKHLAALVMDGNEMTRAAEACRQGIPVVLHPEIKQVEYSSLNQDEDQNKS